MVSSLHRNQSTMSTPSIIVSIATSCCIVCVVWTHLFVTPVLSQEYSYIETNSVLSGSTEYTDIPQGASSLAFVFDVTGSMHDDLVQVIEGAAKILATTLARRFKPLYNYVLVPFHDPEIGPVTVTTDPDAFQRVLRDLYVLGGGDCPEMSIGAIKMALEMSLPNSYIYVFTDARAKDFVLVEQVLTLIQQKQTQVVFVMTGDCGNTSHPGFKAYEQIASTSSGQIFLLKKPQVNQILDVVRVAINSRKVNLVSLDRDDADTTWLDLPIDSKLKEFTLSISGLVPNIEITDPNGLKIRKKDTYYRELLKLKNALVVNVKSPIPGLWKLKLSSKGPHTIRITGLSTLDFVHGFSRHPTMDLHTTTARPIKGVQTHLLLNATQLNFPGRFTNVNFMDLYGNKLMQVPVTYNDAMPHLYNISALTPPDDFFYLTVHGLDPKGYDFQRTTPTAISPVVPDPPNIHMPKTTRGFYDKTAILTCDVTSLVPYNVQWYRDRQPLGSPLFYTESANVTWSIPDASSFSEGVYSCNATNSAGYAIAETYLDVKDPPPIIHAAVNASGVPGRSSLVICEAFSTVDFNYTWYRASDRLNMAAFDGATVHPNGSLEIHNVEKSDEGPYVCRASNEGGYTEEEIWLLVEKSPIVTVIPSSPSFVVGDTINFTCTSVAFPEPTYAWRRNGVELRETSRVTFTDNGRMTITDLAQTDAGEYECVATNIAGTGTATSSIQYQEAPRITVSNPTVLVNNGDEAVLNCEAVGIPPPTITWQRGDIELRELSFMKIHADGSLHIMGAQEVDEGDYTCIATNNAGSAQKVISLDVGSGPIITRSPSSIGVEVLMNTTLPCFAIGKPKPEITWQHMGGKAVNFSNDRFSQHSTGALQINGILKEDEGMYTCVVTNQFGAKQVSAFVTVTGIVRPLIAYSSPHVEVIQGRSIQLSCIVLLGNPQPKIMWVKMGEEVRASDRVITDGQGTITILSAEPGDEGEYTCIASNVGGNATYSTKLDVQVPPQIEESERDFTVRQGESIMLPCKVSGDPLPSITWTKNGVRISETNPHYFINIDGSLDIFSADPRDTATYSCTALNIAGVKEKRMTLFVQTPPQITDNVHDFTVIIDNPVQLPCEVIGVPNPTVTWHRDGVEIQETNSYRFLPNGAFRITRVKIEDEGIYECLASSVAGNDSKLVTVTVQVPPTLVSSGPAEIVVTAGEEAVLDCDTVGSPNPMVSWRKDLVKIDFFDENSRYLLQESGSLFIPVTDVDDTARYLCMAENPAGVVTREISLIVHEPPYLPENTPTNTTIIENNRVTIPCPVQGTPLPQVRWYKDEYEITGNEIGVRILADGSLQLDRALDRDAGQYVCVAQNVAGNLSHTVDLVVFLPPRFNEHEELRGPGGEDPLHGSEDSMVILNNTIRLNCPASANPPPQITWYRDGVELPYHIYDVIEGGRIQIMEEGKVLMIQNAELEDTAKYTCIARNPVGEGEMEFDLEVQVPPSIDENFASSRNMSVIAKQVLIIDCPASGVPEPKIVWYKDGFEIYPENEQAMRILSNGRRLEVMSADISDSGEYKCVAQNPAGQDEQLYNVDVWIPAKIDGSETVAKPEVDVGDNITLFCPASGVPLPKVSWWHGVQELRRNTSRFYILDDGWQLLIVNADVQDTSRFSCRAENAGGDSEKYFDLSVLVPPRIDRSGLDTNPKVILNRTVIINCPVSGIPDPEIAWLRAGELIDPLLNPSYIMVGGGRQLRIDSAQVIDAGKYQCFVVNKAGDDSVEYDLEVHVPTMIGRLGVRLEHEVIEHSSVTLDCPVVGIPIPDISWYHAGELIDVSTRPNLRLLDDDRQLLIQDAWVEDTGLYECRASNEAGSDQLSYTVDVLVPPTIEANTSSDSLLQTIVNRTTTISCVAAGVPTPEIKWLFNGVTIDTETSQRYRVLMNGRQLEIFKTEVPDTGRYTCIASNDAGVTDRDFDLDVLDPPYIDDSNIIREPKVIKGKVYTLHCPAMGIPFPNVTWLKGGQPIEQSPNIRIQLSGRQLQLIDVSEEDSGRYTCVAQNIAGEAKENFDVQVLIPPSIDEANLVDNPRVITNRTVLLECPVAGTPPPHVQWLKNGEPLVLRSGMRLLSNSRQLKLEEAQVGDTARYTCIATNEAGKLTRNFDLEVYVPPTIAMSHEITDIAVVQNRTVYIHCYVEGIPAPSILWLKDGVLLLDEPHANIRELEGGKKLELRNVQLMDEGEYNCQATNPAGQTSKAFRLQVQVPPHIEHSRLITDLSVIARRSVSLECQAEGDPMPEITWLKDNDLLEAASSRHVRVLRGGRILQIMAAEVQDAGKYTCLAVNVAGEEKRQFDLQVHVPPEIEGSQSIMEQSVVMGGTVSLECIAAGVPDPTVTWLRQGQPFTFTSNPNLRVLDGGRRLQIINAQLLDIGGYTCVASNVAGNTSREYILGVQVPPTIEDGPTQVVATVNRRTMLHCETLGLPEPEITWHRDGEKISNSGFRYRVRRSGTLEFSSVAVDDTGEYTCTAKNPAGEVSRVIQLNVQVPPTMVQHGPVSRRVTVGEQVSLPCQAEGHPTPTIQWRKGTRIFTDSTGYTIREDGSLEVDNVDTRDSGIYVCIAENSAGTALGQVRLEVLVPPSIEDQETEFIVNEDGNIILPCRANGMPAPRVWWEKDGQRITHVDFQYRLLRSGWLAIPVTSVDNSGSYTCIAENDAGRASMIMDLVVHVPPSIEPSSRLVTVTKGGNTTLLCSATGMPPPNISWIQDGRLVIRNDSHYHIGLDGQLSIINVEENDAGSYVCTARNKAGRKSKETILRVQVPPLFTTIPQDKEAMAGGRIELLCAAEGIPTPYISWRVNGSHYPVPKSYNGRSRLIIDNASKRDDGTYMCVAENMAGERRAVAAVRVKVPPKVLLSHGSQAVSLDARVVLHCPIEGGDPPPQILWLKNELPVMYDSRVQIQPNGSLVIYDSNIEDAGEYTCVATNDAGTDEGIAYLTVNGPPTILVEPEDTIVHRGRVAVLNCVVESIPSADVIWYRGMGINGPAIESEDRLVILPNNSLMIVGAQRQDSRPYTCQAINDLGSEIASAQLRVRVDGGWAFWSSWSECSVSCGLGMRTRYRECNNPEPADGGRDCHGMNKEVQVCAEGDCPVDGGWSVWSPWERCSKSCESGEKTRMRECNSPPPQNGGQPCQGDAVQSRTCNRRPCPVNGEWGSWSAFGACSTSCGDGFQERFRQCDNPAPADNGRECLGRDSERQICTAQACGVDGAWSAWMDWSGCSLTCGGGTRTRRRRCDNPRPSSGGRDCSGSEQQTDYCSQIACPVHGHWSEWSEWGECSKSCDRGQRHRFRTCSEPPPKDGGRFCEGIDLETGLCNESDCAVDGEWSTWGAWSQCTQTCDGGMQERRRRCRQPRNGGSRCRGDRSQMRKCNIHPCRAGIPRLAEGSIIGTINNREFGVSRLHANITRTGQGTRTTGLVIDIPEDVGIYLQHLISLMSPIYWTTATEVGEAINGYTLTQGHFQRHSTVQFSTGEVVDLTHVARGLSPDGTLQVDILVEGEVPRIPDQATVVLLPFVEDYIQTGPGSIYAYSSREYRVNGRTYPYEWNHTITYDAERGRQPFLVQRLTGNGLDVQFDVSSEVMKYMVTASIARGDPSNQCPAGFYLEEDGPYCQDENECLLSNMCSHSCVNAPGSYFCTCRIGYTLGPDGRTCQDTDECEEGIAACHESQDCINTVGSYQCLMGCGEGLRRTPASLSCEDVNECVETPDVCPQRCINVRGGYRCACERGYQLVGRNQCQDEDECADGSVWCSHSCVNTVGSFYCSCPAGYQLQDSRMCIDVDECETGQHQCGGQQECENKAGGYNCINSRCLNGYEKAPNGTCVDKDECMTGEHKCYYNQVCVNTRGGYSCTCAHGYRSQGPNQPCTAIHSNGDGVYHACPYRRLNRLCPRPRDASTRCPQGYHYVNGKCVDIDECQSMSGCQHNCHNTLGSYRCTCPAGYRLSANGRTCQDIDECRELQINCGADQMCFNRRGDFQCINTPCPRRYDRDPNTGYCVLDCSKSRRRCPQGVRYADIIHFMMLPLAKGIDAHEDIALLRALDEQNVHLLYTNFTIIENDPDMTFGIRNENGRGVVYTKKPLVEKKSYMIKVRARSTDHRRRGLSYSSTFLLFISVSSYPY